MSEHGEFITQSQQVRNAGVLHSWFPRWTWNTAANFQHIRREFLEEKHLDYALFRHRKKYKGPAMIVGAGPSFDQAAPLLTKWKAPIFVPESMAHTCAYYGRDPEFIGLYDAHPAAWDNFFEGYDFSKSTLLTHPAVSEKAIKLFPGPRIYYTMMHIPEPDYSVFHPNMEIKEMYEIVKQQQFSSDFFEAVVPILYPYIATTILNAGCVVNNLIQCAHFMGYDPLVLCGVDFGYADGYERCTGWHMTDGKWIEKPKTKIENIGREMKVSENGIATSEEQIEYKIAMMAVYKTDKPNLIDCSNGIVTELPKYPVKEVIKKRARGYKKVYDGEKETIALEFLEKMDNLSKEHRANSKKGLELVETENKNDVPVEVVQLDESILPARTGVEVPMSPELIAEAENDASVAGGVK